MSTSPLAETHSSHFKVGSLVCHRKDDHLQGVIAEMDADCGGLTTCRVAWGARTLQEAQSTPRADQDVQWTNKLVLLPAARN